MTKRSKPDRTIRTLDTRQLGAARGGALDAGFTISDDFKRLRADASVISDFVWPAS